MSTLWGPDGEEGCSVGAVGAIAGDAAGRFPVAGSGRSRGVVGRSHCREPRRGAQHLVLPSGAIEPRGADRAAAREPVAHLQCRLRPDERPDGLPDGELLRPPGQCRRLRSGLRRHTGGGQVPRLRSGPMTTVTIFHNPACGTSRNTLGLIRNSDVEPEVIEYLKTPPGREQLADLIRRMGVPVREVMRRKGTPYAELGLDDPSLTADQLLDAMMAHPILINRPIVVTPLGVRLCRPSEAVLDILPNPQL